MFNLKLNTIDILGKTIELKLVDYENMGTAFGLSRGDKQLIKLTKDFGKERMESTLLHEILHMLSDELNLGLTEHQVHVLEAGLYQVLSQPGLLKLT
jgi:hypothetical protein